MHHGMATPTQECTHYTHTYEHTHESHTLIKNRILIKHQKVKIKQVVNGLI